jgi:HEAT repeat protein
MNEGSWIAVSGGLALLAAMAGFAAGYAVGTGSGRAQASAATPSVSTPSESIRGYGELLLRKKGTFRDQLELLKAEEQIKAREAELVSMGPRGFDAAVLYLESAADPAVREAVVALLARLDRERAPRELAARLLSSNEHEAARAAAAGALAHLDRAVALPALLASLERTAQRYWAGGRAVVEALAFVGGPEAEEGLLRAFEAPTSDPSLRYACAEALGTLRSAKASESLERVVRHETADHNLRRIAVQALIAIDRKQAAELVRDQLTVEQDPSFRSFLESVDRSLH